jgi:hypothetical protein
MTPNVRACARAREVVDRSATLLARRGGARSKGAAPATKEQNSAWHFPHHLNSAKTSTGPAGVANEAVLGGRSGRGVMDEGLVALAVGELGESVLLPGRPHEDVSLRGSLRCGKPA